MNAQGGNGLRLEFSDPGLWPEPASGIPFAHSGSPRGPTWLEGPGKRRRQTSRRNRGKSGQFAGYRLGGKLAKPWSVRLPAAYGKRFGAKPMILPMPWPMTQQAGPLPRAAGT